MKLIKKIENWDGKDVNELRQMLVDLKEHCATLSMKMDELIDTTSMPFCDRVPDEVGLYPCWTMDQNGYCLVGDDMDNVEHIDLVKGNK